MAQLIARATFATNLIIALSAVVGGLSLTWICFTYAAGGLLPDTIRENRGLPIRIIIAMVLISVISGLAQILVTGAGS